MKQLIGTFISTIIKVVIFVLIIMAVYKLSVTAYDFGFQIFADKPVATGEGRTVNVIISADMDEKEVAKLLEEKGLVKDANVFYIQEKLSLSGKDDVQIQPGTYELNTAMTAEEMIGILTATEEVEEE